jgi:diaminopimelate epimerase
MDAATLRAPGLTGQRFRKVHGAGNDFILLTDPPADLDWAEAARVLCQRRTGVGADGLVIARREEGHPYLLEVRCFNADGSEATMCGNALRCAAFCAAREDGGTVMTMRMAGETYLAEVDGSEAAVTAPAGAVTPGLLTMTWNTALLVFDAIDTGTEHVVAVVSDVDDIDVELCGRVVRSHQRTAPAGTNVNFTSVISPTALRVRTYERGVEAETLSCGSGAVAAVAVARSRGLLVDGPVGVHNQAGTPLTVTAADDRVDRFWVRGPVEIVCQGVLP